MEWEPPPKVEVLKTAVPLLIEPGPSVAPPSMKVTVPLVVRGSTVVVNVTNEP
jgi:hypothetical protein